MILFTLPPAELAHLISSRVFPEGSLWQVASQLNTLLTNENDRLRQLTEDLQQKHSQMTTEVCTVAQCLPTWEITYILKSH